MVLFGGPWHLVSKVISALTGITSNSTLVTLFIRLVTRSQVPASAPTYILNAEAQLYPPLR